MRREEVLEYEARRRLFQLIDREPGLHLRELERRLAMPMSTLRHHVRYLEAHGLVENHEDRNVRRYFATALTDRADRRVIAALRQESLRRVLLYVLDRGGSATYQEILVASGSPASTLAVYLSQLTRRGLLVKRSLGRESRYDAVDPERSIRLLHRYRTSFVDVLVDRLLDVVYQDEP